MSEEKISCSGALFYSKASQRFLFLHRTNGKKSDLWGMVGGKNQTHETPWEGLCREIKEEIGNKNDLIIKTIPLEVFISNDEKFEFYTYLCVVREDFIPVLNEEHDGYAWVAFNKWPKPLHNGLKNTLQSKVNQAKLKTSIYLIEKLLEE